MGGPPMALRGREFQTTRLLRAVDAIECERHYRDSHSPGSAMFWITLFLAIPALALAAAVWGVLRRKWYGVLPLLADRKSVV